MTSFRNTLRHGTARDVMAVLEEYVPTNDEARACLLNLAERLDHLEKGYADLDQRTVRQRRVGP